jgi:hypothetical protein
MDPPDLLHCRLRGGRFSEGDALSIAHRPKEAPNRIAWQRSGEEQPIHRPIYCKFRRRTAKDEQEPIHVTPDLPRDGVLDRGGWHQENSS